MPTLVELPTNMSDSIMAINPLLVTFVSQYQTTPKVLTKVVIRDERFYTPIPYHEVLKILYAAMNSAMEDPKAPDVKKPKAPATKKPVRRGVKK